MTLVCTLDPRTGASLSSAKYLFWASAKLFLGPQVKGLKVVSAHKQDRPSHLGELV